MTRTMSASTSGAALASSTPSAALLPLMAVVLISFLVIGVALPVLPLHVHDGLGFGPFAVGVVVGCQFAASLVARIGSGRMADTSGPKRAVVIGLCAATAAGLLYLVSLGFVGRPRVSLAILLAGRAVLGAAESYVITGATTWGLARAGDRNAGQVIAWMGTSMFAALAFGAPLGTAVFATGGFPAVAAATALAPLAALLLVAALNPAVPARRHRPALLSVLRRIWLPGVAAALGSIGFGAIIAFASLLFVARGWTPVWAAFTAYALSLVAVRLLFGHLPDRIGGARVALASLVIEAAGLALMGLASSAAIATVGAALTGIGYSLVFPALGVEAVRRAPPESRGVAMGAYTACLDVALGVSGPVLGLVAGGVGLGWVFLVGAMATLCAAAAGVPLLRRGSIP